MFTKFINILSKITDYNALCIPILLIIIGTVSYENNQLNLTKFLVLTLVTILSTTIFTKIIIFVLNRQKRYLLKNIPIISNVISYFIGFILLLIFNMDLFMTLLFLTYSINSIILLILLKNDLTISVNAFYICGLITALIMSLGHFAWPISILYASSLWPNIFLKKYSPYQEINSGIISFITVPLIMYILMPYNHIFDIAWIIFSLIIYPIIYEISEYYELKLDKWNSELVLGATLLLFTFFAPYSIFSLFSVFITSVIIGVLRSILE